MVLDRAMFLVLLLISDGLLGLALFRHVKDLLTPLAAVRAVAPDPMEAALNLLWVILVGTLGLGVFARLPSRVLADELSEPPRRRGDPP